MMTEGVRDAYLGLHQETVPPPWLEQYDFGQPECFVPQRLRVLAQLKTVGGVARALLGLADIRR
jgi:hypothetical protein